MPNRSMRSRLATTTVMAAMVALTVPLIVNASSVVESFTPRFSTTARGGIELIGNTLMTCTTDASCTLALDGNGGSANDNNDFSMIYVDADSNGSTFASSSADLTVPNGATILFAGLYWGAESSDSSRDQVKFKVPGGSYQTVTANSADVVVDVADYAAFADVTADVAGLNDPNGTYWVADVQGTLGTNQAAGWSLVVVYGDDASPWRNLTVFDGYLSINTNAPSSITTTASGFLTPPSGPVAATVGMVTFEGDLGLVGDQFLLNGTNVSDAANPTDNVFNSSISDLGVPVTDKNPNYLNQLGFDIDEIDGTGYIPNSSTSATLSYTTQGDVYYPTVLTFAVDVFMPELTVTKTLEDVNGNRLAPGDEIEYTVEATSSGIDSATDVVLVDPIPAGTTYVPNSISIVSGANAGGVTDASGDDVGEYDAANDQVVVRLGTGADDANGGTMDPAAVSAVRFRVTLDQNVVGGTTIENQAVVDYSGQTAGGSYSAQSDSDAATPGDQPAEIRSDSPPVAGDDSSATNEDQAVEIDVLANDDDPDGKADLDHASVQVTSGPGHGQTSVDPATGAITYTPDQGYSGPDQFDYEVCDKSGMCDSATVDVTVNAVPHQPDAVDDSRTTAQDTPVKIDVLGNDHDPDGKADLDPSSVAVTGAPSHGQTGVDPATGAVTYTPDPGYSGPDQFTYRVCDSTDLCDSATVDVTVQAPNAPPVAHADQASTAAAVPVVIDVLNNDAPGANPLDPSSVAIVSGPSHGVLSIDPVTGSITYQPDAGYDGPDSFTYQVCDTQDVCTTAQVNVTVLLPDTAQLPPGSSDSTLRWPAVVLTALVPFALLALSVAMGWRRRRPMSRSHRRS